jgi:hypothetical protein
MLVASIFFLGGLGALGGSNFYVFKLASVRSFNTKPTKYTKLRQDNRMLTQRP